MTADLAGISPEHLFDLGFIERRSYDSLALPKLFLGSLRGHRLRERYTRA
jgi:hypothetical protein